MVRKDVKRPRHNSRKKRKLRHYREHEERKDACRESVARVLAATAPLIEHFEVLVQEERKVNQ